MILYPVGNLPLTPDTLNPIISLTYPYPSLI